MTIIQYGHYSWGSKLRSTSLGCGWNPGSHPTAAYIPCRVSGFRGSGVSGFPGLGGFRVYGFQGFRVLAGNLSPPYIPYPLGVAVLRGFSVVQKKFPASAVGPRTLKP